MLLTLPRFTRWPGNAARPCSGRVLSRFRRREDGALAVEFALIAPVFFGLLFGIMEVALTFWSTQVLETAVANAARQIYTGSFQQTPANSVPADALVNFKKNVCDRVTAVFNCQRLVSVDVQKVTEFSGATLAPPINPTTKKYDVSNYGYNPPADNEIGVVRASMEYPVYVNIFGYSTGLASGNRLIMATSTFKTEPYK